MKKKTHWLFRYGWIDFLVYVYVKYTFNMNKLRIIGIIGTL